MLETPHVIVAAAIAFKIGNPAIALPLALGSHFILEKVPHWNPHLNTELKKYGSLTDQTKNIIVADTVASILGGTYIASLVLPDTIHAATILAACFMGALPDIAEAPYFLWHKKSKFLENLVKFQKSIQNDTSLLPGLLTQAATILAAFLWILQ